MRTNHKRTVIFYVAFIFMLGFLAEELKAQGLFQLNGNGGQADLGNNCYRLTQAVNNQFGSMWYRKKADLTQDFDMEANLNFGSNNGGADGIVFAFQNVCTSAGGGGGGIGITGVSPSLFVEFDTYTNSEYNDANYDHIALLKNGVVNHNTANSLVSPTGIISGNGNVETGADFLVRVWWTAADSTLRVYVNNDLRLTYTGNVVDDIFSGSPYVYWGFTAATGGLNNLQSVCMVSFPTNEISLDDAIICLNDSVQVNLPGGVTYTWTPNYNISNTTISNPYLYPDVNTQYIVSITDACNNIQTDTINVTVNPLPNVMLNLPISDQCLNDAAINLSGGTPAGGNYNGIGVSSGMFDPFIAGIGNQIITYSYTDLNGCTNTAQDIISVNSLPNVGLSPFPSQCANDPSFSLFGGTPSGGTYSGPGVSNNQFNPAAAGPGSHTITYTYTNTSGCVGSANTIIVVNASPSASIGTPNGIVICSGSSIILNTNSAAGVSYQWFLDGNSVTTSDPANISYSASNAGVYTLVATHSNGCSAVSSPVTVTSGTAVTANISSTLTNFCPGDSVQLSTILQGGESAQWYFNSNIMAGITASSIWVQNPGDYSVLVTSSSGCTDFSNNITINQLSDVNPTLTSSNLGFCPGTNSITLTANSASGASYAWYQNGNLITGANGSIYNATSDGNYYVVITASSGCSTQSATLNLINSSNPIANISTTSNSFCQGSSVTLDAGNTSGLSYSWYLNGNLISGSGSSINANQAGDYYVLVTNSTGCTGTSNTVNITEQAAPIASISASSTTFCPGSNVNLSANVVAGGTYEWFRNSVSLGAATLNNNTFTISQSGTYYCVINDGCAGTSNSINIIAGQLPGNASSIYGSGIGTFCPGESFDMFIFNTNGATYYQWTITPSTAGSISVGQGTTDVTVNLLNQNATITVTPQNACGNGGSSSETMLVDNPNWCQGVNFGAYSTNTCVGSTVTYTNFTDNSLYIGLTPNWDFGAGASPQTFVGNGPVTVTYNSSGVYSAGLYYVDAFGNAFDFEEKTDYIYVSGNINTGAISGNTILPTCTGSIETYSVTNTAGSTYNWTVTGGNIVSGQGSNQISVNFLGSGGSVSVTETNVAGCVGTAVNLSVNCLTNLTQMEQEVTDLKVYPNPNNGEFNISYILNQSMAYSFIIIDLNGKIVEEINGQAKSGLSQTFVDLKHLSKGIYFLKVQIGTQVQNRKIVIQ
ncbi:MAG TPA: T9SS type A sorting domain-containing protein [Bacteroidia bacterium]|nr:T9SS type A sorting domain-containing protein [Bacteroidia bacterium]